jgi:hypothetical protein
VYTFSERCSIIKAVKEKEAGAMTNKIDMDIKRYIRNYVSSYKKVKKYLEDTLSWGRGSEDKYNALRNRAKKEQEIALIEIDSHIKHLEEIKRLVASVDFKMGSNEIEAMTMDYRKTSIGDDHILTVRRYDDSYGSSLISN